MDTNKMISLPEITEKKAPAGSGLVMLPLLILLQLGSIAAFVMGCIYAANGASSAAVSLLLLVGGAIMAFLITPIMWAGLKIVKPNEAVVLILFGKFYGVLKESGYYYTNPFAVASVCRRQNQNLSVSTTTTEGATTTKAIPAERSVSLKTRTLNNGTQKINDLLGNPVHIGIVVIWRVVDIYSRRL